MIDTTGKCSVCGQTVGIDTIHTCSPQAPRPRVSEHTDAARLEALRDSMRPRVEGEELATITSRVRRAFEILGGVDQRYNVAIECLLETAVEVHRREGRIAELRVDNARLTAEVERLRDSMRPRVEGEARMAQYAVEQIAKDGAVGGWSTSFGGMEVKSVFVESPTAKALALDLLDARQANAALTAEVERLTKEKAEVTSMAWELVRLVQSAPVPHDPIVVASIRSRLATLAPSPAPMEGTNDD